jgi:hypothetical protein
MKNKHVQRGITNYTKAQKKESIGKAVRMPKADPIIEAQAAASQSRRRVQENSSFQDKLRYFYVFIGLALVGTLSYVIVDQVQNAKKAAAFVSEEAEVLEVKHPNEKDAVELTKRFLEAKEVTGWAGVASGDQEEIPMAFAKLAQLKKEGWKLKKVQHLGPRQITDRFVDSLLVSGSLGKNLMVNLVNIDGSWKVDPGSSMQVHSKDWEEFFETVSTTGRVRVSVTDHANYYNGLYDDENIWHAYTLTYQPDLPAIIGYVKRNSSCDLALQNLLKQSTTISCVLNLHRDVQAEKNQYEIENVVSADWVISELVFSDQFIDQSVPTKKSDTPQP